jgi:hypothetical protein
MPKPARTKALSTRERIAQAFELGTPLDRAIERAVRIAVAGAPLRRKLAAMEARGIAPPARASTKRARTKSGPKSKATRRAKAAAKPARRTTRRTTRRTASRSDGRSAR